MDSHQNATLQVSSDAATAAAAVRNQAKAAEMLAVALCSAVEGSLGPFMVGDDWGLEKASAEFLERADVTYFAEHLRSTGKGEEAEKLFVSRMLDPDAVEEFWKKEIEEVGELEAADGAVLLTSRAAVRSARVAVRTLEAVLSLAKSSDPDENGARARRRAVTEAVIAHLAARRTARAARAAERVGTSEVVHAIAADWGDGSPYNEIQAFKAIVVTVSQLAARSATAAGSSHAALLDWLGASPSGTASSNE